MQVEAETLLRDYIRRLEAAAWPLAVERRVELAGEVREHIETALAQAGSRDETTVRNVLERLGPPEEIVAAEVEPGSAPDAAGIGHRSGPSPWGPVEIVALLLLTVGAVLLPVVGPFVGLVFVWLSGQWTTRNKLIATAIVVAFYLLPFVLLLGARSAA
jgi:hypothetical protein